MSNYNSLKTTIDANIKQNGRQEITGQILNSVLNQMVTTLGAGYQFAGVATLDPATDPGTPDAKVFYIANGKGTYTNFGSVEVTEDDVVVLYWDSSWHKVSTGIASQEKLSELGQEVGYKVETDFTLVTSSSKQTKRVDIDNSKNISAAIYFNGGITTNNNHIKVALYKDVLNSQGFVWESDYFGFNETISYEGQNDFNILYFEVYPNVVATAGDAQIVVNTGLFARVNQNTENILLENNANIQEMYFAKNYVLNGGTTSDDNGIVIGADIIWTDGVAGRLTLSSWNDNACEYAIETATHSTTNIVYSKQFNSDGSLIKETITISNQ